MTGRLGYLGGLAAGLSREPGIGIEKGAWAWSPTRNAICVPDIVGEGLTDRERGAIAHESAHVRISRYLRFPALTGLSPNLSSMTLNAIEDCRVHEWLVCAYGSVLRRWLKALRAGASAPRTPGPSIVIEYLAAVCIGEVVDYERPALWALPDQVEDALSATREARRAYAQDCMPAQLLDQVEAVGIREAFETEAIPLLSAPVGPVGLDEAMVLIAAARAWQLAEREIAPVVRALWRRDLELLEGAASSDPLLDRRLRDRRLSASSRRLTATAAALRRSERGQADAIDAELSEALDAFIERALVSSGGGLPVVAPDASTAGLHPGAGVDEEGRGSNHADDDLMREALDQVASLAETMRKRFISERATTWRRGFRAGPRLSLPGLMQAEADPRFDRIWGRFVTAAPILEAEVVLMIDLSGSMASRSKIQHASAAVIAMTLAFQRLPGLSWEVLGFQDEIVELVRKGTTFEPAAARQRMLDAVELPAAAHNDDGPCLLEAAARMRKRPGLKRVIMVLSDGRPAGRRSTPDDLRSAIRQVTGDGITVIGLGVGPARHVKDFYPISAAEVPLKDLGQRMASLLESALS